MLPSPAASLAILLMMGETLVGPYSWILGRQFWYASTTPWISDQKEKTAGTQLAAVTPVQMFDNICPIIWAGHPCVFVSRQKRDMNDLFIDLYIRFRFAYIRHKTGESCTDFNHQQPRAPARPYLRIHRPPGWNLWQSHEKPADGGDGEPVRGYGKRLVLIYVHGYKGAPVGIQRL